MAQLYYEGYRPDNWRELQDRIEVTRHYHEAQERFSALVAGDQAAQNAGIAKQANYLDSLGEAADQKKDKISKFMELFKEAPSAKPAPSTVITPAELLKSMVRKDAKGLLPGFDLTGLSFADEIVAMSLQLRVDGATSPSAAFGADPARPNTPLFIGIDPVGIVSLPPRLILKLSPFGEVFNLAINITETTRIEWANNPDLLLLMGTAASIAMLQVLPAKKSASAGAIKFIKDIMNKVVTSGGNQRRFVTAWMQFLTISGRGFSAPPSLDATMNELTINLGALEAGNHHRKIVARAFKLIGDLYQDHKITKSERIDLERRVEMAVTGK